MAVLAGRTQRVLANGVYSGLAVAAGGHWPWAMPCVMA